MICRGCGKKLSNGENMCRSCGFYNETRNDSLEDDDFKEVDFFNEPVNNTNNPNDLTLDDDPNEDQDSLFDDEDSMYDDNDSSDDSTSLGDHKFIESDHSLDEYNPSLDKNYSLEDSPLLKDHEAVFENNNSDDDDDETDEKEEINDVFRAVALDEPPKKKDKNEEFLDDVLEDKKEKKEKKKNKKKKDEVEYLSEEDSIDYVAAFIGEDYKWIVNKPINIYALIFSWIYFLYRKMYITGIIGLVIVGIVTRFVPLLLPVAIILSMVLSAVLFNPLYLNVVKRRVQKIIDIYGDESESFILDKCVQTGGVSTSKALFIFLIFLVVMFFSYYSLTFGAKESKFWKDNTENRANCIYLGKEAFKLLNDSDDNKMTNISLEELACQVILDSPKSYDLYLKVKNDDDYRYIYFEDKDDEIVLKGDTKYLNELLEAEKNGDMNSDDKLFLDNTRNLSLVFSEIKDTSESQAEMEKKKTLTSQRTHFVIDKSEIYVKVK